jgi:hypothetical protein
VCPWSKGLCHVQHKGHRDTTEVELTVGIEHGAGKLQGLVDVPAD